MRMSLSEILQNQLDCWNGNLVLKFRDLIHHLKKPNKKREIISSALLCSPKFIQLIWYMLVSAQWMISLIQQVDIQMLLHQLILLVLQIHHQTHLLLRREGKILVYWFIHYNIIINSITDGPLEDQLADQEISHAFMNAECLLQYSQDSNWCWGVESTPQCHPHFCALWLVSSCPGGHSKGTLTSSVCADYLLPFFSHLQNSILISLYS